MLYTLLCYNKEDVVWSWSKEEDEAVMTRLSTVHENWSRKENLGLPCACCPPPPPPLCAGAAL